MEANVDQLDGGTLSWTGGLGYKTYGQTSFLAATFGVYIKPSSVRSGQSHPYARMRAGAFYLANDADYSRKVSWTGNAGVGYRLGLSERVNLSLGGGLVYTGIDTEQTGSGLLPQAELALGFAF